jgi:hypothetical protein
MNDALHSRKFLTKVLGFPPDFSILKTFANHPSPLFTKDEAISPEEGELREQKRRANTSEQMFQYADVCLQRLVWTGTLENWEPFYSAQLETMQDSWIGNGEVDALSPSRTQLNAMRKLMRAVPRNPLPKELILLHALVLIDMMIPFGRDSNLAAAEPALNYLENHHPSLYATVFQAACGIDDVAFFTLVQECDDVAGARSTDALMDPALLRVTNPILSEVLRTRHQHTNVVSENAP